jgi:triacylglycerol lipase
VAERVEELARDHRWERIDLVGHSEGGLIGRYYVQKLDGARRVRHLITLGTPHRGTRWAYSGSLVGYLLPSLRQMVPGSPLLRDLADDSFPAGVRLTSIYSQRDSICPPSSCRLEAFRASHLRNVEVMHGGHLGLLFSTRISSIIRRELESGRTAGSRQPSLHRAGSLRPPGAVNSGRRPSRAPSYLAAQNGASKRA